MSTTVQIPPAAIAPASSREDALGKALIALETLFRQGAVEAESQGKDPVTACRGDFELMSMWLPELYERLTDPARRLEDLAADHELDIRVSSAPGLTEACLLDDESVLVIPAGQPATKSLAQLRAALTAREQA
jgi:hypothetical protein